MDDEIREGIEKQMQSSAVYLNGEVYVPLEEAITHAKAFIAMSKRAGKEELEQRSETGQVNTVVSLTDEERNWKEDYHKGIYANNCRDCGETFYGYKYRRYCKLCSS